MVYDFIIEAGYGDSINSDVAECIYTGVMTDTGSFRFPSTSANVHKLVAFLKTKGLQHSKVHEAIYDNFSETRLRFIGNVLLNRMQVFYEYNTALIAIPQSDLLKYDIKTGDTEGLVNYPLSIEGIRMAAIIIDRGEERKCSFRSKGEVDVNTFARKYFNGGGHFNAAGGQTADSLEVAVDHFIHAMKENKEILATYQF
jgi:phosphoesterase RecJ-like protein